MRTSLCLVQSYCNVLNWMSVINEVPLYVRTVFGGGTLGSSRSCRSWIDRSATCNWTPRRHMTIWSRTADPAQVDNNMMWFMVVNWGQKTTTTFIRSIGNYEMLTLHDCNSNIRTYKFFALSGFYELSDAASGSLSNSSNSVFSECFCSTADNDGHLPSTGMFRGCDLTNQTPPLPSSRMILRCCGDV